MPVRLVRLVGLIDRGILGVVHRLCQARLHCRAIAAAMPGKVLERSRHPVALGGSSLKTDWAIIASPRIMVGNKGGRFFVPERSTLGFPITKVVGLDNAIRPTPDNSKGVFVHYRGYQQPPVQHWR